LVFIPHREDNENETGNAGLAPGYWLRKLIAELSVSITAPNFRNCTYVGENRKTLPMIEFSGDVLQNVLASSVAPVYAPIVIGIGEDWRRIKEAERGEAGVSAGPNFRLWGPPTISSRAGITEHLADLQVSN
jgi:hypothetical protein